MVPLSTDKVLLPIKSVVTMKVSSAVCNTIMTNASSARLLCVVMLPAVSIRTIAGVHSGRSDRFNIINSNNSLGTSFKSKGTKDITWETNTNFNIGAEFQLWNRVTGSIEYYRRKTSDMLFSFTVAPSLGYASYMDNVGNMVISSIHVTLRGM